MHDAAPSSDADREYCLVLVNVQAPRDWTPGVNSDPRRRLPRCYRDVASCANWHGCHRSPRSDQLAGDQIHPGGPVTERRSTATPIRDALQRLAELPPLRTEDEYRYADRPV